MSWGKWPLHFPCQPPQDQTPAAGGQGAEPRLTVLPHANGQALLEAAGLALPALGFGDGAVVGEGAGEADALADGPPVKEGRAWGTGETPPALGEGQGALPAPHSENPKWASRWTWHRKAQSNSGRQPRHSSATRRPLPAFCWLHPQPAPCSTASLPGTAQPAAPAPLPSRHSDAQTNVQHPC